MKKMKNEEQKVIGNLYTEEGTQKESNNSFYHN